MSPSADPPFESQPQGISLADKAGVALRNIIGLGLPTK